jgi:ribosomal protein L11 methyltransferase
MKWSKITLETTTAAVDLIGSMLSDLGIEGIEIEDKVPLTKQEQERLFIDIPAETEEDDGIAQVNFYVDESADLNSILNNIRAELSRMSEYMPIGSGNIIVFETEDKDWLNNWKQFFTPFKVYDNIVIKPTWEEYEITGEDELVIELDPGITFGTGSHETTKLCIIGIKKYIKPGMTMLDAGSGSGILSIIAKKLGAGRVTGIDIDPIAATAAVENARVNNLEALVPAGPVELSDILSSGDNCLCFITGNILKDEAIIKAIGEKNLDMVVANILAEVIIPLSSIIGYNLKPGGIFITSGIINTAGTQVKDALIKNGFEIIEENQMNDWVSFISRRI